MPWIGTQDLLGYMVTLLTLSCMTDCLDYYTTSPLKAFDLNGHLGNSATLRCQLRTGRHNRGWFRLTWARIEPDGTALPLVHLPVRDKIPNWSKHVHPDLRERIKPLITIQPGHVEFNIRVNNVTCEDEAAYRCSAVTPQGELLSVAVLTVLARPRPPRIIEEDHHRKQTTGVHRHKRIRLKCQGDVGLPPRDLVWYVKTPQDIYFNMIDRLRDSSEESDGCHVIRTQPLTIHSGHVKPGTRYRCGYPGFIAKKEMYDEMVIEERHVKVRDIEVNNKGKRKEDLRCQQGKCLIGRSKEDGDGNHGNQSRPFPILHLCLVVMFSRLTSHA